MLCDYGENYEIEKWKNENKEFQSFIAMYLGKKSAGNFPLCSLIDLTFFLISFNEGSICF